MREKGERREWKDGGNKRGYMKRENRGEMGKKGRKGGVRNGKKEPKKPRGEIYSDINPPR